MRTSGIHSAWEKVSRGIGHTLSYALLVMAVLGYSALPSNHPAGFLQVADSMPLAVGSLWKPSKTIAPSQARENRSPDLPAVTGGTDLDGFTPAPALLPRDRLPVLADAVECHGLRPLASASMKSPRAPPSFRTA